jgi:hypothetical protein
MNESHPCSYCGTQLDQDGNQLHSGLRPWEGQCREYVKAASNVKDRELVELKTKLEAADRRIQFWQDERERERQMRRDVCHFAYVPFEPNVCGSEGSHHCSDIERVSCIDCLRVLAIHNPMLKRIENDR